MVEAEEDVMIDVGIAAVAAVERADQVVLLAGIDVVRADEAQRLAEPAHGLVEFGVISTPWPMRFTCEGPFGSRMSSPARNSGSLPELSFCRGFRDRRHRRDAVHHLDLIAVRLSQPHALAAAGSSISLDAGGARRLGDRFRSSSVAA